MLSGESSKGNYHEWERRSKSFGSSLKSVLYKGMPDAVNEHLHNWHTKIILENIEKRAQRRILDAGCGYGRLSIQIIKKFPDSDIVGMDISENYVELYQKNTNLPAFVAAVENIPSEFDEFDCIICVTVLMYLEGESLVRAMENLLHRLKAGGKIILIENDQSGVPFQTGFGLVKLMKKRGDARDIDTGGHIFKKNEIKALVANAGGKIVSEFRLPVTTLCILPMWLVGYILPYKLTKFLFNKILLLEELLGKLKLPSIYVAYVVKSK
jgi:SAM-dependent methyltransferase